MTGHSLLEKWKMLQAIVEPGIFPLSPSAKVVAARLLHHLNSRTGQCYPSYQTLAEGTGLSRRTIIKLVKELEKVEIIKVVRPASGNKEAKGETNRYDFDWAFAGLWSPPRSPKPPTGSEPRDTTKRKSRPVPSPVSERSNTRGSEQSVPTGSDPRFTRNRESINQENINREISQLDSSNSNNASIGFASGGKIQEIDSTDKTLKSLIDKLRGFKDSKLLSDSKMRQHAYSLLRQEINRQHPNAVRDDQIELIAFDAVQEKLGPNVFAALGVCSAAGCLLQHEMEALVRRLDPAEIVRAASEREQRLVAKGAIPG
jgi:hypothetical protein